MKKKTLVTIIVLCIVLVAVESRQISNIFRTCKKEAVRYRISKTLKEDFNSIESFGTTVYFRNSDEKYIRLIIQTVDTYYPLLKDDFDIKSLGKVTVVVYPDEKLLQQTLKIQYETTPMGVFYGGVLNILSPSIWLEGGEAAIKTSFLKNGPIVHELAHYVLDAKTNGNYPLWFTEGVALYYEKKYTGFEWHPELKRAAAQISLTEMQKNFSSLNEFLAYRKTYDVTTYLVDKYGEDYIQLLMTELAGGMPTKKFNRLVEKSIQSD